MRFGKNIFLSRTVDWICGRPRKPKYLGHSCGGPTTVTPDQTPENPDPDPEPIYTGPTAELVAPTNLNLATENIPEPPDPNALKQPREISVTFTKDEAEVSLSAPRQIAVVFDTPQTGLITISKLSVAITI